MRKNRVRLNESQLRRVINESVKGIIREMQDEGMTTDAMRHAFYNGRNNAEERFPSFNEVGSFVNNGDDTGTGGSRINGTNYNNWKEWYNGEKEAEAGNKHLNPEYGSRSSALIGTGYRPGFKGKMARTGAAAAGMAGMAYGKMRNKFGLSESQLNRIIKESINNVLGM